MPAVEQAPVAAPMLQGADVEAATSFQQQEPAETANGGGDEQKTSLVPYQVVNVIAYAQNFYPLLWFWIPNGGNREAQQSYLLPAVYAFGIWIVIFAGELIFTVWQAVQRVGTAPPKRVAMIKALCPWWFLATFFQSLWLATSNATFSGPVRFLLPTVALVLPAVCFSMVHKEVVNGRVGQDNWYMRFPLTLHFGWGCAAALVMVNEYVAVLSSDPWVKASAALASVALAGLLGTWVSVVRRHAVYGFVITWATFAVGLQTCTRQIMLEELGRTPTLVIGITQIAIAVAVAAVSAWVLGNGPDEPLAKA